MRSPTAASAWLPIASAIASLISFGAIPAFADDPPADRASIEFFEREVRPILVERCQGCHGAEEQKGDLRLDARAAILEGGLSGPAIEPGDPEASLLVEVIGYEDSLRMPPKSRLPAAEVEALTKWVALGAPWPDGPEADGSDETEAEPDGFDLDARADFWSFRPLADPEVPEVADASWPRGPIDRFMLARLESEGLAPAPETDRRTLVRRLTFDLIGLPPTPEEIDTFLDDKRPDAYERLVDRLLASPRFGERWGRHWLDLVRYAETAGHEFDYDLPDAWRYRDYVVRALNADLPYDRFVVEHLAGDLLPEPRRDPATGLDESMTATGFYALGEGVHSPVDVREDEVRRIDNQIDVLSKAFLGLTVACARCHDHKFDAIRQRDYYALAGFLKSSRHQHAFLDPPAVFDRPAAEIAALKAEIASSLSDPNESPVSGGTGSASVPPRSDTDSASATRIAMIGDPIESPRVEDETDSIELFADFAGSFEGWTATGPAFGAGPSRPGDYRIEGDSAIPVEPGQAHSGLISDRLAGVLRSPSFDVRRPFLHILASGKGGRITVVVDGFTKVRAPIYGGLTFEVNKPGWYTIPLGPWLGHRAFIEAADGATVDYTKPVADYISEGGWLALAEVRFSDAPTPPSNDMPTAEPIPLVEGPLPSLLARYRAVEDAIPPPTLAPAFLDGAGEDEFLLPRGDHTRPADLVARRYLEAFDGPDSDSLAGSGRLELARRMLDPISSPLPARVAVNRLWLHHFGRGIVATPDDFGHMGEPPSHPELLDYLASRLIESGWSLKSIHREIVTSRAYRMSSRLDLDSPAETADPANRLVHRANIRRLEAEAIRDAILAASGRLVGRIGGPSVAPHLTEHMKGRGRPAESGPLDGDGRRSLDINVRRNFLTPLLLAFDYPPPASTVGRRNASNVPAQALTLLDDPFVLAQAQLWGGRLADDPAPPANRVDQMFVRALGRPPSDAERSRMLEFLGDPAHASDPAAWEDLAHVLFNVKEFLFID